MNSSSTNDASKQHLSKTPATRGRATGSAKSSFTSVRKQRGFVEFNDDIKDLSSSQKTKKANSYHFSLHGKDNVVLSMFQVLGDGKASHKITSFPSIDDGYENNDDVCISLNPLQNRLLIVKRHRIYISQSLPPLDSLHTSSLSLSSTFIISKSNYNDKNCIVACSFSNPVNYRSWSHRHGLHEQPTQQNILSLMDYNEVDLLQFQSMSLYESKPFATGLGLEGTLDLHSGTYRGIFIGAEGTFALSFQSCDDLNAESIRKSLTARNIWTGHCSLRQRGFESKYNMNAYVGDVYVNANDNSGEIEIKISLSLGNVRVEAIHDLAYSLNDGAGESILQAEWHPYNSNLIVVLSSKGSIRLYNINDEEYYLPKLSVQLSSLDSSSSSSVSRSPVSFTFLSYSSTQHSDAQIDLWSKNSLFILYSDGSIFMLCPFITPDTINATEEELRIVKMNLPESSQGAAWLSIIERRNKIVRSADAKLATSDLEEKLGNITIDNITERKFAEKIALQQIYAGALPKGKPLNTRATSLKIMRVPNCFPLSLILCTWSCGYMDSIMWKGEIFPLWDLNLKLENPSQEFRLESKSASNEEASKQENIDDNKKVAPSKSKGIKIRTSRKNISKNLPYDSFCFLYRLALWDVVDGDTVHPYLHIDEFYDDFGICTDLISGSSYLFHLGFFKSFSSIVGGFKQVSESFFKPLVLCIVASSLYSRRAISSGGIIGVLSQQMSNHFFITPLPLSNQSDKGINLDPDSILRVVDLEKAISQITSRNDKDLMNQEWMSLVSEDLFIDLKPFKVSDFCESVYKFRNQLDISCVVPVHFRGVNICDMDQHMTEEVVEYLKKMQKLLQDDDGSNSNTSSIFSLIEQRLNSLQIYAKEQAKCLLIQEGVIKECVKKLIPVNEDDNEDLIFQIYQLEEENKKLSKKYKKYLEKLEKAMQNGKSKNHFIWIQEQCNSFKELANNIRATEVQLPELERKFEQDILEKERDPAQSRVFYDKRIESKVGELESKICNLVKTMIPGAEPLEEQISTVSNFKERMNRIRQRLHPFET